MFLAQVEAGIKTIDHVASQNDRWAFFASLGILLVFGYFVLRYFMIQSARQSAEHAATLATHTAEMRALIKDGNESNRTLAIAMSKNTDILDRCLKELEKRK